MMYDSTFEIVKSIVEASGGDMSREYDSTYSLVEELIELSSQEGKTEVDFTPIGYSVEGSEHMNETVKNYYNEQIAYSKRLYDEWDPSNNTTNNLYKLSSMVFAPSIDTSNVINMGGMFTQCRALKYVPMYDTSKVTNMGSMFSYCYSLISIPQLDTSNVKSMSSMFNYCQSLTSIPQLDTSNVTTMNNMFSYCTSLTSIPQLDTSNVTTMDGMFGGCTSLTSIPLLDCSSISYRVGPLGSYDLDSLTDIGGFKDLKVGWTGNFLNYAKNLTVESLMNVINNLYDLTANGLSGQTLKFGTDNLNKLTADQIAVATNKGWTLT